MIEKRINLTDIKHRKWYDQLALYVSVGSVALILAWIGLFKFTPSEARSIKPLVENHPFMSWMYDILSVQGVSSLIGIIEIALAILLLLSLYWDRLRKPAAIGVMITFLTTISFLFTTPGMWRMVDGVPITDFFILKDLLFLGIGITIYRKP